MRPLQVLIATTTFGLSALLFGCGQAKPRTSALADSWGPNDWVDDGPSVATLRATDGTSLVVAADVLESMGSDIHKERDAKAISITLTNAATPRTAAARAVLINVCTDAADPSEPFSEAVQCDLAYAGGSFRARVGPGCDLSDYGSSFTLYSSTAGGTTETCTQQIAVVVNGTWLVDPINGTHNFNFRF
jgi:hypothetical protein